MAQSSLTVRYDRAREISTFARWMSCACGGWIVGGAAKWLLDLTTEPVLRDIDVLIPYRKWHEACRAIPAGTPANSFGGFKVHDKIRDVFVDVWPDDLDRFLKQSNVVPNYAVELETYSVLEWHGRAALTKIND